MLTKKGFTLIELLVVIAIIAILAAILFPVFAKAREKARQTACLNNTKQIGLGLMQYVQDYDETYPGVYNYDTSISGYSRWTVVIQPYVKNTQVFQCPSQAVLTNVLTYQTFPTSYAFNYNLAWSSEATAVKPASTVAMCDSGSQATLYTDNTAAVNVNSPQKPGGWILVTPENYAATTNGDWCAPAMRHSERCNVAFADGHSKSMSASWYYLATPWLNPAVGGD